MREPQAQTRRGGRSLMVRLVLSFLVLSMLTVAIVGVVAYQRARASLQGTVFDRLDAAAEGKAAALDRWVDEQRRNLVFVAGLMGGYETSEVLGPFNERVADLLTEDGLDDPASHDAAQKLLDVVVTKTADAQEFLVLDLSGNIVVSTVPQHEGLSQADQPWFAEGSSNTFVHPVSESELSDAPVITIATPLFDSTGQRIGVMAATLNLERLDRIVLERTGLGDSGETYIVGTDGRFVHARLLGEYPDPVTSEGIERAIAQHEGRGLYENYDGEAVIGVYHWLPEVGAAQMAEMSQDEAFRPARELSLTIGLVGVVVVASVAIGIYFVSRRIARPILAITDTAAAVTAGDLSREAPVSSRDEVGTLARAFNTMTSRLRGTLDELRASQRRLVAAQDDERRKLERNIHDGAQQQLVALAVKMRLAQGLATKDAEKTSELLDQLQVDTRAALQDLRDLAHGIYPPLLADQGLPAALEAQARKSPTPVDFDADGVSRYAPEIEAATYFCVLEALQNVGKYAQASLVSVRLGHDEGSLTFRVEDDGKGFDATATSRGTGLQGMIDRLSALSGEVWIDSHPGVGTVVAGRIPLEGAEQPDRGS
jgi:signal transduction histidine kinase